ncbi:TPA: ead/Ea22-like family protein [Citrobacter freundii]
MSNIDKQALREEFQLMQDHYSDPADRERQVIYIAAEALLDGLDAAEKLATQQGNIAAALLDEVTTLRRNADDKAPELRTQLIEADNELEALRQRIAELEARAFNLAILDVIAERQRQQSVEGWTPEHDDQYGESQLLWASSCYVLNTIKPFNRMPMDWPWAPEWWKPTNPRRNLVKAGALILAEIERIDRQESAQ